MEHDLKRFQTWVFENREHWGTEDFKAESINALTQFVSKYGDKPAIYKTFDYIDEIIKLTIKYQEDMQNV